MVARCATVLGSAWAKGMVVRAVRKCGCVCRQRSVKPVVAFPGHKTFAT